jgi:hypothetical protein
MQKGMKQRLLGVNEKVDLTLITSFAHDSQEILSCLK